MTTQPQPENRLWLTSVSDPVTREAVWVRFNTRDHDEALRLAECVHGDLAYRYLFHKRIRS